MEIIRKMKKVFLIAMCCFIVLLCGCVNDQKPSFEISNEEILEKLLAENNYMIVDIRTEAEYEAGHVIGAIHIPYEEINDETMNSYKDKTILVYCQDGDESSIACTTLREQGYETFDLGTYDAVTLEKE